MKFEFHLPLQRSKSIPWMGMRVCVLFALLLTTFGAIAIVQPTSSVNADAAVPASSLLTQQHPRLLGTADDFARVKNEITTDPYKQKWYAKVKADAQAVLTQPPSTYDVIGPRLLEVSRKVLGRMYQLGMMYQLDGDQAYVDRAWKELEAAAGLNPAIPFPDWNSSHFLDTAEMTNAFAIGYDWMYAAWTPEQRTAIRTAMIERGLNIARDIYRGDRTGGSNRWFWVNTTNNWSIVSNGGISVGAMAIGDEVPELADEILSAGFANIKNGIGSFMTDGSYNEGTGYWGYATSYLTSYLASLTTSMGSEFGLSEEFPGITNAGDFPLYLNGPKIGFNYGDTGPSQVGGAQLFWMATRYNKPLYGVYQRATTSGDPRALLWYDVATQGDLQDQPLDRSFDQSDIATSRPAWNQPNAPFIGFKAGGNQDGHNDLDLGTFMVDALGTRWADELGQEDYNSPGYWEVGPEGRRWNYYRKRAEGQNTLVINPDAKADQDPMARTDITRFDANERGMLGVMDLTPAYARHSDTVQRGIRTLDFRRQMLIQDEITNKAPSEVWWFMHTRAKVDISEDGRSAILTIGKNRLWANLVAPVDARFSVMDAVPLPTSPAVKNTTNTGVRKLTVHLSGVTTATIGVHLVPLREGEVPPAKPLGSLTPLDSWKLESPIYPKLREITIDGKPLEGFRSDRYTYEVVLPAGTTTVPTVKARVKWLPDQVVKVTPAKQVPGTTQICVLRTCTHIAFRVATWVGPVDNAPKLAVTAVTVSAHDGNVPENTLDNNLSTRWSAEGEQWIQYDLGQEQTVGLLGIAFYSGNQRLTKFDIDVSTDGSTWNRVFSGWSSGETASEEVFDFTDVSARYVRLAGHGNSVSGWNSLSEVVIYGSLS